MGKLQEKAAEYHEQFAARIIQGAGGGDRPVAEAVAAILRTGSPSGKPAATLRPVLRKRCRLAATRTACVVQLSLQALQLLFQPIILPLQSVALALQPLRVALAPRQLFAKPFEVGGTFRSPRWGRFPVGGRHATVMP